MALKWIGAGGGGVPRVPSPERLGLYCWSGPKGPRSRTNAWVLFIPQLHNAANANQKEKYEADLKKEIKKLQVRGLGVWIPASQGQREQGGGGWRPWCPGPEAV